MPHLEEQFFCLPDGMRLRYAWFQPTIPSRGTILCLGGRREFIEKDFEVIEAWLKRGFKVVALDLRGQGGSGRMLANKNKSHIGSFDEYRSDINEFYRSIVKPQLIRPLIVFGHSMGAFVALEWLLHDKPDVKAAILATPMLALPLPSWLYGMMRVISCCALGLGFGNAYTFAERNYSPKQWHFKNNYLTHDPERLRIIPDWFARRPEFSLGGVTYSWIDAAVKAITKTRKQLKNIVTPTLVLNAGADRVVLSREVSKWTREIPGATEKIYPGALHDLMCETDDYLSQVWRDIDNFLQGINV